MTTIAGLTADQIIVVKRHYEISTGLSAEDIGRSEENIEQLKKLVHDLANYNGHKFLDLIERANKLVKILEPVEERLMAP